VQLDLLGVVLDPLPYSLGSVDPVLVHDQVHLGGQVLDQPLQEAEEHSGGERALEHGQVQLADGADRAHRVDAEPVAGPGHGRGLAP